MYASTSCSTRSAALMRRFASHVPRGVSLRVAKHADGQPPRGHHHVQLARRFLRADDSSFIKNKNQATRTSTPAGQPTTRKHTHTHTQHDFYCSVIAPRQGGVTPAKDTANKSRGGGGRKRGFTMMMASVVQSLAAFCPAFAGSPFILDPPEIPPSPSTSKTESNETAELPSTSNIQQPTHSRMEILTAFAGSVTVAMIVWGTGSCLTLPVVWSAISKAPLSTSLYIAPPFPLLSPGASAGAGGGVVTAASLLPRPAALVAAAADRGTALPSFGRLPLVL